MSSKLFKKEEIANIVNEEKIRIYEYENSEIQIILKAYWEKQEKEKPEFSNIREEINYIINQLANEKNNGIIRRVMRKLKRLTYGK